MREWLPNTNWAPVRNPIAKAQSFLMVFPLSIWKSIEGTGAGVSVSASLTGVCHRGQRAWQAKLGIYFVSCKAQCKIIFRFSDEGVCWSGGALVEATNKTMQQTRGSQVIPNRNPVVFPSLPQEEEALQEEGKLSAACHTIVMSHSKRTPS